MFVLSGKVTYGRHLLFFFLISLSPSLLAWDSNGHKLIAEIAYENLTPEAQKTVLALLQIPGPGYTHRLSFSSSAAWADWIRHDTHEYDALHYIDLPYCGHEPCDNERVATPNIVTAIQHDSAILQDKHSNPVLKGQALRFYLHWLGDIHEPMHSINYYSKRYPQGDAGGNLYSLQDSDFSNLHVFWDDGCGLWPNNKVLSMKQVRILARRWQARYPQEYFQSALIEKDPLNWAKDSHALAIQTAYEAAPYHRLSQTAQNKAKVVCQKQMVLAGYRLAQNLNAWYAKP